MRIPVQVLGLITWGFVVPAAATAQVGHTPEGSPYRDLRAKQAASVVGGYIGGSRGKANVGPAGGQVIGIRYDHAIGVPADIQISLSYAHLQRYVVEPGLPELIRTSGPIFQDVIMMETGGSLVVMGRKTWHGFAPYVGATFGVAFETGLSIESSGYQFGTKLTATPHLGFKWYPLQAFSIKVEGRDYLWRLSYPNQYAISLGTGLTPVLPSGAKLNEWTHHPALLVSVGYTFTF